MKVHSKRPNPPPKNTVIADAKVFKTALAGGTWTAQGEEWKVITKGSVNLRNTKKKNNNFTALPNPPAMTLKPDQASDFTVSGGAIT